jgi:hypothetical protein
MSTVCFIKKASTKKEKRNPAKPVRKLQNSFDSADGFFGQPAKLALRIENLN